MVGCNSFAKYRIFYLIFKMFLYSFLYEYDHDFKKYHREKFYANNASNKCTTILSSKIKWGSGRDKRTYKIH